jgi:hypothetical protein
MPLTRLVSHKHPCEMNVRNSGIVFAVSTERDEEGFRSVEKETEREFVVRI